MNEKKHSISCWTHCFSIMPVSDSGTNGSRPKSEIQSKVFQHSCQKNMRDRAQSERTTNKRRRSGKDRALGCCNSFSFTKIPSDARTKHKGVMHIPICNWEWKWMKTGATLCDRCAMYANWMKSESRTILHAFRSTMTSNPPSLFRRFSSTVFVFLLRLQLNGFNDEQI